MRILYIATRICWPVRSGAHLRDFHLAGYLASHANLTYVGMDAGENGAAQQQVCHDPIEPFGNTQVVRVRRSAGYHAAKFIRGLVGPKPLIILNYTSRLMAQQIEQLLGRNSFDVIQIEGIFLNAYAPLIRRAAPKTLLNADWHNIESEVLARYAEKEASMPRRLYARRTLVLLRAQEDRLLAGCHSHTVCSEREREVLLSRNPSARIEVIPNGVDVARLAECATDNSPRRNLIFVGSMDYHANVDAVLFFAKEVWPPIYQRRPDLQFVVVGSKPVAEVLKLKEQPGITVTGTVNDVCPYYHSALAAVVPLRIGGGTRLKILEAMAAGTPVISTAVGAEGIPVRQGVDILLADTPADMVECAVALRHDSELWRKIASEGRKLAKQYEWQGIGERLVQFYETQLRWLSARAAD